MVHISIPLMNLNWILKQYYIFISLLYIIIPSTNYLVTQQNLPKPAFINTTRKINHRTGLSFSFWFLFIHAELFSLGSRDLSWH